MKRLIVTIFMLLIAMSIFYITPNYEVKTFYNKGEIRLVIDDTDVTKKIPDPVLIIDDKVMLSQDTIDIYFDKWLYYDEKYKTFITTNDDQIAKLKIDSDTININGKDKKMETTAQKIGDITYFPIEELTDVYKIQIVKNEKVIVTTDNPEFEKIKIEEEKIKLKSLSNKFSRTVATVDVDSVLEVFRYSKDKAWVWCRTENGELGYASADDLSKYDIAEYVEKVEEPIEKINLIWEYAESSTPERTEGKIDELDVVAPTWIYLTGNSGSIRSVISDAYIKWAHKVGYKVWATFKNDHYTPEELSSVLTDLKNREKIVKSVIDVCVSKNVDGINIDFENMLQKDSTVFSEFVRELAVECRKNNLTISVDVTVPDGSDTWSLCYDRYELSEAVDYIILMSYDQHGSTSKIPGSVASYNWVETNIKKMIERDGIDSRKLVLGIPLYTRIWYLQDGKMYKNPTTLTLDNETQYLNSKNTKWLDDYEQYYYEYSQGNKTTMIWLEDTTSIIKKLGLIKEYNLGGSAYWRWGYESTNLWNEISNYMNY